MAETIQIDNLQAILNEFAKAVSAATTAVNNLSTAAGSLNMGPRQRQAFPVDL